MRAKFDHQDAVLDCSFITATTALAGGLDGQLKMFDLNTHSETVVGTHNDAITCVEWNSEVNLAVTGSWDKQVGLLAPPVYPLTGLILSSHYDRYDTVYST